LSSLLSIAVGLASTLVLAFFVRPFVAAAMKRAELLAPKGVDHARWEALTEYSGGARFLGFLECLVAFAAFWRHEPLIIAAWLTFKVAAKWEVWKNVVQVPQKLGDDLDPLDWLTAKNAWGTRLLNRFLIGTLANILVGLTGASIGHSLANLLNG
jgi:hypothetical protein